MGRWKSKVREAEGQRICRQTHGERKTEKHTACVSHTHTHTRALSHTHTQNTVSSPNPHSVPTKHSFPLPTQSGPTAPTSVSRKLTPPGASREWRHTGLILDEGRIPQEGSFCVWLFGSRSRIFYMAALLSLMAISLWPHSSDLSRHQPDSPVLSVAPTLPCRERERD